MQQVAAKESWPQRETILVVDDEPQVLVALEDLLSDEFVVLKSDSAEKALHVVEQQPDIAVVVSDQRMPRMHGDELFKNLRGRFDAERILATGFADLTAVIRAVNDGQIFAYVTKPWDPGDLRVKIQRAAEHFRLSRELAHERRLLVDLMHSIPDVIYFKDAELNFQRFNGALLRIFGLTDPSQIAGHKLSEIFQDRESSARLELEEREILRTKTAITDRVTSVSIAGGRYWYSTTKAPIVNEEGDAIGLVGVARDVTSRIQTEERLRSREEQLRLTFLASSAGMFDWDLRTKRVEYSPSMTALLAGNVPSDVEVDPKAQLHPDDLDRVRRLLAEHLEQRTPLRGHQLRVRVDGKYRWLEINARAVWDSAGRPTRVVGSAIDITERKEQEARIQRLTRIHAVLSSINSAILRVHERRALLTESCSIAVRAGALALAVASSARGPGARTVAWAGSNASLADAVSDWLVTESTRAGSPVELAVTSRRPVVVHDVAEERERVGAIAESLTSAGHVALAVLPVLVSGQVDCVLGLFANTAGFFDDEQVKLLAELADNIGFALEHGAQAEQLQFLAYHDELTGLPNRRLLSERLTHQLGVCRENQLKLALVLIDIERFRHVNETLGRRAGDEVLTEAARRMLGAGEGKWSLSRFANNTFGAIVGPLDDESHVAQWLEQALLALGHAAVVAGTELRLSARAGIALFPSDGQDAEGLIANAEAALKKAKASAQRYLFYAPGMNGRVAERLTLETKLRKALEQDEFLLHYQPKVELKTGRVVGLEALIRWQGSDGKLIPPGLFVPVLEETGMIVDVGEWVLDRAAAQHRDWSERGVDTPRIAVNVSPLQLAQPSFVPRLEALLRKYPRASSGLDLEITESVLMDDLVGNTEKLRQAKLAGLSVAIDDFGTGYSSLGYLSRLPIDALKIDRSFVLRMSEDPQEMSIVTTIISLAHSLDLKVVAEGVETAQQAHLLRLLKCDQIQGYLVARPQAHTDVEPLLTRRFSFTAVS